MHELSTRDSFSHFNLSATSLICTFAIYADIWQMTQAYSSFGPVAQYYENSKYYSAIKPAANKEVDTHLPHITVEYHVYKESLSHIM